MKQNAGGFDETLQRRGKQEREPRDQSGSGTADAGSGLQSRHVPSSEDRVASDRAVSRPGTAHFMSARLLDRSSSEHSNAQTIGQMPATGALPYPEGAYWMVGAYWKGFDPPDQTARFLEEGTWENGYDEKFLGLVKSMKVGDRIAIKAATTQRRNLPFDAGGYAIPKMVIKAIGTITHNPQDGYRVEVDWDPDFEPRDWYFYTCQQTVWRLRQDDAPVRQLIDFAFRGAAQDYGFFAKRWWRGDSALSAGSKMGGSVNEAARRSQALPYSVADMLAEGVLLDATEIELALGRFRAKKNLILQGPPGVGKTFVARKLAYALAGARDDDRVAMVQFHQSYSYEDFVRGYRPSGSETGGFALVDGPFVRFCERAKWDPDRAYVFIIDEINRGNLGQIFGELLTLLEADKRGARHAIALAYARHASETFHVPENVHVLGTMNLADRSLAMVDYALRRRFAFVTLAPQFEKPRFRAWLVERRMDEALADLIVRRMTAVNRMIAEDRTLGLSHRIGHSVFVPEGIDFAELDRAWYDAVVKTEIAPLLEEYWQDDPQKVAEAVQQLLG
jgi:5-methylcytosine-specific restriction protein B